MQSQCPQPGSQPGSLGLDQRAHLLGVGTFLQCCQPGRLRQTGDRPRLPRRLHTGKQSRITAQRITQPQPRHSVELGESLQDHKLRCIV